MLLQRVPGADILTATLCSSATAPCSILSARPSSAAFGPCTGHISTTRSPITRVRTLIQYSSTVWILTADWALGDVLQSANDGEGH